MPELPEVENVVRQLRDSFSSQPGLQKIEIKSPKLRHKLDKKLLKNFCEQKLLSVSRKAKYIVFQFSKSAIISHLGMTGEWRVESTAQITEMKHDHLRLHWSDQKVWTYRDPRRFGMFHPVEKVEDYLPFAHLGAEPLSDEFDSEYLFARLQKSKGRKIKIALMDQALVVGIGNIYVSEVLFRAGVRPERSAGRVKLIECEKIVSFSREILRSAIEHGGSSIQNYRRPDAKPGEFQNQLLAYGREKRPCYVCEKAIRQTRLAGRSSFWCSTCQK
jgi:formamidopyrimidine-DNA glycosylase